MSAELYSEARRHADEAFADHRLTVLHEHGLYRHLRFAKPGTWMYGFDLVTWPGYLHVGGDIADYTFARVADMFEFFAGDGDITPVYWGEKVVDRKTPLRRYARARLEERVAERLADEADEVRSAWQEHIAYTELEHEYPAREALRDFEHNGRCHFEDAWEWDVSEWDHHFLLSCFAIKHGVAMYRAREAVAA